ncbi:hypothetical protein BB561_000247 [Smittium simulii]|uniref:Chloride channel protein n=1 Tax=Smittium simulii TaxID=133385 RepID=A0A2T9YZV2_9FUNG|nr:hypothetical protein BB561_000247 [Smittium simulii]
MLIPTAEQHDSTARFKEFETIDWIEEAKNQVAYKNSSALAENNSFYSVAHSAFNLIQVWIVIFLVAAIIGLNTAVISIVTEWLSDIKLGYCSNHWWLNEKFCCWQNWNTFGSCPDWKEWSVATTSYNVYILDWIMYIFFGAIQEYAPYAAGSGLPEIKTVLAGYYFDKFMNGWTLIIKSIGLAIAVSSGLSVGKEGPAVHMVKLREILSASAAAGIAVAFGSPIGGVLFSLEDISYVFPLKTLSRSFFCALIATTVLHVINPFRTGKIGLCGAYLTKINIKMAKFRKKIDMGKLLSYLFQECEDGNWANLCTNRNTMSMLTSLLFATIARFIGTALAYGCKIPCGIFVPSMAIGATFGRMLGNIVQILQANYPNAFLFAQCHPDTQCVTSATYAFLGATAALTGITRVTVAVVVIMYELTGAVNFIVPTMIVVMVAKVVADYISPGAISEQMIFLNGLPFIELESSPLGMQVSEIMTKNPVTLPTSGMTIDEISAVDFTPIVLDINTSTETVEEIFTRLGPKMILVEDITGRLVGLVTRKDFIRAKLKNSSH